MNKNALPNLDRCLAEFNASVQRNGQIQLQLVALQRDMHDRLAAFQNAFTAGEELQPFQDSLAEIVSNTAAACREYTANSRNTAALCRQTAEALAKLAR